MRSDRWRTPSALGYHDGSAVTRACATYASPSCARPRQSPGISRRRRCSDSIAPSSDPAFGPGSSRAEEEVRRARGSAASPAPRTNATAPATRSATAIAVTAAALPLTLIPRTSGWSEAGPGRPAGPRPPSVGIRVRTRVRVRDVGELRVERDVVGVHAVTDRVRDVLVVREQYPEDHAQRLVDDVVGEPTPVGEAGEISTQHAEPRALG